MSSASKPTQRPVRGRFAPSPTGPLHFGSLVAALGSYLQARSQGGEWLVRMEDLDPPREVAGAADDILRTLEAYGLYWDGEVVFQSQRHSAYEDVLNSLVESGHSFPCGCSRKSIAQVSKESDFLIYPGTCRNGLPPGRSARTIRLRVPNETLVYTDKLQGQQETALQREVGDFVIRRADGFYAYHLAVVVDDDFQGITEILRGADLLQETAPQRLLQRILGLHTPEYAHLPIAVNAAGEKLSKQTHAPAVNTGQPGETLYQALSFLGHVPGPHVNRRSPRELLVWGVKNWDLTRVPKRAIIPVKTA